MSQWLLIWHNHLRWPLELCQYGFWVHNHSLWHHPSYVSMVFDVTIIHPDTVLVMSVWLLIWHRPSYVSIENWAHNVFPVQCVKPNRKQQKWLCDDEEDDNDDYLILVTECCKISCLAIPVKIIFNFGITLSVIDPNK